MPVSYRGIFSAFKRFMKLLYFNVIFSDLSTSVKDIAKSEVTPSDLIMTMSVLTGKRLFRLNSLGRAGNESRVDTGKNSRNSTSTT